MTVRIIFMGQEISRASLSLNQSHILGEYCCWLNMEHSVCAIQALHNQNALMPAPCHSTLVRTRRLDNFVHKIASWLDEFRSHTSGRVSSLHYMDSDILLSIHHNDPLGDHSTFLTNRSPCEDQITIHCYFTTLAWWTCKQSVKAKKSSSR